MLLHKFLLLYKPDLAQFTATYKFALAQPSKRTALPAAATLI